MGNYTSPDRGPVKPDRRTKEGPRYALAADEPTTGITVATHDGTGVSWLLHGGVAGDLARHSAGPVLCTNHVVTT